MPLVSGKLIGKYRNLLIPFTELAGEAHRLAPSLRQLSADHDAGRLNDAEYANSFVCLFGTARQKYRPGEKSPTGLAQIKGMPGMISSIIHDWRAQEVKLHLTALPVSSRRMLQAQAEGWRYVTIDMESAVHGQPVEGTRDAFEFALHDLGHAYAFFKPEYDHSGQVDFFRLLQNDLEVFAPYVRSDALFADALDYCMADMNSHPQHLRQYVQGVIVEMFLRRREKSGENEEASEVELNSLLGKLTCLVGFAKAASDIQGVR